LLALLDGAELLDPGCHTHQLLISNGVDVGVDDEVGTKYVGFWFNAPH